MCLRSEAHVRSSSGKRRMKGCGLLVTSNGVGQGSTEMTTRKVRQGFQGRSWGAANKMFLISQLGLEYVLVVIRVLGKKC